MSSGVCLTVMGMVMLKDRADTSKAVTFTLALLVMQAESSSRNSVKATSLLSLG